MDEASSFMERIERVVEPVSLPAEDDEDEEQEQARDRNQEQAQKADTRRSAEPTTRSPGSDIPPAPARRLDLLDLVSRLDVQVRPNGGLQINAPPESAAALASLLEGLAGQLRAHHAPRPD